jgi:hypothetical protein
MSDQTPNNKKIADENPNKGPEFSSPSQHGSKLGCPTGICDRKKLSCCKCKETPEGEEEEVSDSAIETPTGHKMLEDDHKKIPQLAFAPSYVHDLEEEFEHLGADHIRLQLKPGGITVKDIKNELQNMTMELAKEQGLKGSISELSKKLGIKYKDNGHALLITFSDKSHFLNFINRLGTKHMITVPHALQQEINDFNAVDEPTNDESVQAKPATRSPLTPFKIRPTPTDTQ